MIQIKNIYYMLSYAYQVLRQDQYKQIDTETFDHAADLFAAILTKGINHQIKRGLLRDYLSHTEAVRSPRGKIDLSRSIKQQTMRHKQVVCTFDNYTENTYMNQILKSTALLLMRTKDVSSRHKKALKKSLLYFSQVDELDLRQIKWSTLTYHRHNATYKMLMNLCYLVIHGLLLTEEEGAYSLAQFVDDQQMHRLYERFVLSFYKKHYPQFRAASTHIHWDIDDGIIDFLPVMKTDITLSYQGKTLIVDTKYYGRTMQTHFDRHTFHSNHLYQIYAYVKNKDRDRTGQVSGVLLYAKTNEDIVPDNEFMMSGNRIGVMTLDLNTEFAKIESRLHRVVERFLLT